MEHTLKTLPLQTDVDIINGHEYALFLASLAKLTPVEQLNFACRVTQHCYTTYGKGEEIVFSIHQLEDRTVLRAATVKGKGKILVEVPQYINEKIETPEGNDAVKLPLPLSPTTMHEIKSHIARIKMAVSLAEMQELPDTCKKYLAIIHRSSDGLEEVVKRF